MKKFINILKQNDCYDKFVYNTITSSKQSDVINEDCVLAFIYRRIKNECSYSYIIDTAFWWKDTPEGHEYWNSLFLSI